MFGIYALYDLVADTIVGGLLLHRHHAAAVRQFSDLAQDQATTISRHLADFELRFLGDYIEGAPEDGGNRIHLDRVSQKTGYQVILTGVQLRDSQAAATTETR